MINSMTGFGGVQSESERGLFAVEIRTVNHRFADFRFRLPGSLNLMEQRIRNILSDEIRRGRVDVYIRWNPMGNALPRVDLNLPVVEKLYSQAMTLKETLGKEIHISPGDFTDAPSFYLEIPPDIDEDELWEDIKPILLKALEKVLKARSEEGKRLKKDLEYQLNEISDEVEKIENEKDLVVEKYRQRLMNKIDEFNQSAGEKIDRERMEGEVLLYADKSDITEEIARIKSHITAFRGHLEADSTSPVGRALDFLCQELHREVNTIGSKCRETSVMQKVLTMKNIVEKLREQVQNIE